MISKCMILQKWDACVFKSVKTYFEIELMVKLPFITNGVGILSVWNFIKLKFPIVFFNV